MGLWSSFVREWGRSLEAAARNPGDVSGTLREANRRRNVDKRREALIQRQGDVLKVFAQKGADADRALELLKQKNGGILPAQLRVLVLGGFILGGHEAKFVFFETDDRTRVDVYYGGDGAPDGPNHGHIIIKKGEMHAWLAHGAEGSNRLRIV